MYYIYGVSGPSLFIESIDSMTLQQSTLVQYHRITPFSACYSMVQTGEVAYSRNRDISV